MSNQPVPLVSVCMITYNHEPFIRQAVEGVLIQKCTFLTELVIGEDCSTDTTPKICEQYAKQYPGIIRLLPSGRNLGMMPNFVRTLQACKGKYIAVCEGDDYWTDSLKLQKQVDFLEANPEYGLVYSDVKIIDKEGNDIDQPAHKSIRERYQEGYIFTELLKGNFITTCSVVFRRELIPMDIYVSEKSWFIYDYWLWLRVATKSKIHFINEATAAYRFHDGGVSHSNGFKDKRKFYNLYFDIIESFNRENAQSLIREEQGVLFRKLLSLLRQPYGTISQKLKILKMMLAYFPGFSNTFKMLRHKYPNSL